MSDKGEGEEEGYDGEALHDEGRRRGREASEDEGVQAWKVSWKEHQARSRSNALFFGATLPIDSLSQI